MGVTSDSEAVDASTQNRSKGDRLAGLGVALEMTSAIRVVLVALWTIGWLIVALPIYWLTRRHTLPLALAQKVWAPGTLRIVGARLEVIGADKLDLSRSDLFVANHSSQVDNPVVFAAQDTP